MICLILLVRNRNSTAIKRACQCLAPGNCFGYLSVFWFLCRPHAINYRCITPRSLIIWKAQTCKYSVIWIQVFRRSKFCPFFMQRQFDKQRFTTETEQYKAVQWIVCASSANSKQLFSFTHWTFFKNYKYKL